MERIRNFVGGEFVDPTGGTWLDVFEPATGRKYAEVADSEAQDVQAAIEAASSAFPAWSKLTAAERSDILLRVADLIEQRLEELVRAESIDTGKPISLARTVDIPRAAANFLFFSTAILHDHASLHDMGADGLNYTLRRPRGVAGLISPWNLPLYLLSWKIAPAIATGNTCVCKPSEVTPMTASMLCGILREAGVPPGVVNIVHGRGDRAGAAIVEHPEVPTLSFTGSTAVGQWIGETGGRMLKRVSLELGGKNPYIVFDDADLDAAIATAERAAFANQGQICLCGSRMLVHRDVYKRFVKDLVARAKARRIGDPLDDQTQHGAQASAEHLDRIDAYVRLARELGGGVHCGGQTVSVDRLPERCRDGYFYEPTVIDGLENNCRVIQEEIFGPVVTVQPFEHDEEAIELANSTPYGLAASIWTTNLGRAHEMARRIDCGIVWVNCWMVRDLRTPFGGMKQSGVGREGGEEALRFFTEAKNVCLGTSPSMKPQADRREHARG